MTLAHLAAAAVALPLGAAAVLAATRELLPRRALDAVTLLVAIAVAAACLTIALARHSPDAYWFGGWTPRTGPPLGIAFAPDRAGGVFAALAAVLVFLATAFGALMFDPERGLFHVLVLAFLGGMTGFTLTADLFDLFVFFELMGVAAFALTGWHADERGPVQGMMTFAVTNTVGAILFLLGTALVYGRTGALNLAAIGRALSVGRPDLLATAAFALISTGLLVKLAVVPFHFWLPDAHAVAPTPICALFSGIMVPLGAFGVARVYAAAFATALPHDTVAAGFGALGAAAATLGGIMALVQQHVKRLLAFSTVAHAGILLAGVATMSAGGLAAAGLHALAHAFLKAALFLSAGVLLDRFESVDVRRLHGRGRALPEIGLVWALATIGLLDLGPTPTGPPAHLLDHAARLAGLWWVPVTTTLSTVLTGAALLRAGAQIFLGIGPADPVDAPQGEQGSAKPRESGRATGRLGALAVPGVAVLVAYGLRFTPGLVQAAQAAAAAMLDTHGWGTWVLDGAPAPAAMLASVPTPTSTGVVRGFVALGMAVLLLGKARAPWAGGALSRLIHAAARPLERLHSGYVGDAVAWIGIGAAFLAASMFW